MRQPIHYPARHAVARASLPRGFVWLGLVCLAMSILTAGTSAAAPSGRSPGGMPDTFLKQHCVRCHDGKVQEGQFRLDTLDRNFTSLMAAERWAEVMTRINAGEMPPQEEPRPTVDEIAGVVEWISGQLAAGEAARMAARGRMTHDRLSREEYANTVYDLLGVRIDVNEPGVFNEDPTFRGFDRIGAMLTLAPTHVERYLTAADAVLARAYPEKPVESRTARIQGMDLRLTDSGGVERQKTLKRAANIGVVDKVRTLLWPGRSIWFPQSIQTSGVYRIRITLSGLRPEGESAPHLTVWNKKQKKSIFEADILADEEHPTTVEFEQFLSAPVALELRHELPPNFAGGSEVVSKSLEMGGGIFIGSRDHRLANPTGHKLFDDVGNPLHPMLVVDALEVEGPIVTDEERRKQAAFWPADLASEADVRACLTRFAQWAWRRPVAADEIDRYTAIYTHESAAGEKPRAAYLAAMAGVLASKSFCYLENGDSENQRLQLNDFELASRLSYFLWGSLPDAPLLKAARTGSLKRPELLQSQVARMIADPKIARFLEAFPHQWLELNRVGMFPPDRKIYRGYDLWLEYSMTREPIETFAEAFRENLPVADLLAGDWSMVNARLAGHYGLPAPAEAGFTRTTFTPDQHRGGLLTQAAVLSLTSDGTRHRPVHRGVWVSEALFGVTPPPPPPNVQPLEPTPADVEKTTIRGQLAMHSTNAACAACHRKIDPLGFAFENYDAIGRWRTHEDTASGKGSSPPVDASGVLPDGRKFSGPDEFKRLLAADPERFAKAVVEKLATFALRRAMTIDDQAAIDAIVASAKADGYRLRTLVEAVATSDLLRSR
jgi:mono/diheme cytochrome c family protein